MTTPTDNLLNERDTLYGKSWKITGIVLGILKIGETNLALNCPEYMFNWIMILNKLVRALASPGYKDHWADIAGYAQLVLKDLEGEDCSCLKGRQ